jgi:malate dehydrogenase (quinone)
MSGETCRTALRRTRCPETDKNPLTGEPKRSAGRNKLARLCPAANHRDHSPSVSTSIPIALIDRPDVLLIGSGIMSANLAVMLKCLEPRLRIQVFEAGDQLAQESSHGWNNAGTGHAGLCELSYTPSRDPDGSVSIARAVRIFEQFEHSKQFWSHLVATGIMPNATDFIRAVPHLGFVRGREDVEFLQARHEAMVQHHFFRAMEYSRDRPTVAGWAPLIMEGRPDEPVGATRMDSGTEVDFGELARGMLSWLAGQEGCGIATGHRVTSVRRTIPGWEITARHLASGEKRRARAEFVFVGAGGGTLPLLQTTGLPEVRGLGGFPIGGQWLVCENPRVVEQHTAKVYGSVPKASPSLGGPHLDRRQLEGNGALLFGPFATWTTKFLRQTGRRTDLPFSFRPDNVTTLLNTARCNASLVRYLLAQSLQGPDQRLAALREFYPQARNEDWRLIDAGIRVQALKRADRGAIYFGTEVLTAADGTLAALLGASPGASVSVNIVLEVIKKCLPHLLSHPTGHARMKAMIPTYDEDLKQPANAARFHQVSTEVEGVLRLSPTSRDHSGPAR